ncbi:MAG: CoA-binding protein [Planctomycetaceae bacterium]|nr:CoA-binding protein [Planctomycetaceae bacterium]
MSSPKVVILGASSDRRKFGNKSVRAYATAGYEVFPVNPREATIDGFPAFPSLAALPRMPFDRISIYLPSAVGITLLDEIASLDVKEVWLNPGSEDRQLLAAAQARSLPVITGCSIVDIGFSPAQFPD